MKAEIKQSKHIKWGETINLASTWLYEKKMPHQKEKWFAPSKVSTWTLTNT